MKKSVPRGRPRKSAITKLKVMAWFNAVAQASGKTAAELEREFADPNHIRRSKENKEVRPNLWDKYHRGEVEPRALPAKGKPIPVVQAVETKYPGTAKWLTLPLWKLADFNQPVTMDELRIIYEGMPLEIRRLILREDMVEGDIFWRKQAEDHEVLLRQISEIGGLDSITTLLAVARESEICQQKYLYECALSKWIDAIGSSGNGMDLLSLLPTIRRTGREYYIRNVD